jgi:acetyl esterase
MTASALRDPEVARMLDELPPPAIEDILGDVAGARAAYAAHMRQLAARSAPPPGGLAIEDITVPSLVDAHQIPVRLYRPPVASGRALLYMHGGAFAIGDLDMEDARCRALAASGDCVVVSVDYRLTPEHPYPTPLEDCRSVLEWMAGQSGELEIDQGRVAVGGCSSGGNLAAGLAIRCRDEGGPAIALQLLIQPVLDAALDSRSLARLANAGDMRHLRRMWDAYLNGPPETASACAAPAVCRDLGGLPPAHIATAALDPLHDEAIAYARRLLDAGASVELHVWPRVSHAFELFAPDARISRDAVEEQARTLVRLLG